MRDPRRECFPFTRERCMPGRRPFVDLRRRQALDTGRHRDDEREVAIDRCQQLLRRFDDEAGEVLLAELYEFFSSDDAAVCNWCRQATTDGRLPRGLLIQQREWSVLREDFEAYQGSQSRPS